MLWLLIMARLWSSGFELNNLAAGVEWDTTAGAAASVVSSGQRSGDYAMRVNGLSSGARSGVFKGGLPNVLWVRGYLFIATLPNADNTIAALGTSISSHTYRLKLSSTGTLKLFNSNGTTVMGTSAALNVGQWYRFEFAIAGFVGGGTDDVYARVDGTEFVTAGIGLAGTTSGAAFGGNLANEAQTQGDWYWDDVAVNDNTGGSQNSWPGEGSIVHLRPNATGDFAEGANGAGGGSGWDDVAETPPDDDTSYWVLQADSSASSTSADRLDVNCAAFSPSATSITLVQVGARVMPASSANCSWVPRIKSQASGTLVEGTTTTITGTAWVTHDDTATTRLYKLTQYTDPQAGGAWTSSLLGTMQIGVRAPDGNPDVRITALWALVEYVASSGFTATAALTSSATTLSASATFAPGTGTATAALTSAASTLSAAATFTPPSYTAAAALTSGSSTLAADATFAPGTDTGVGTLTSAPSTLAADATFDPGTFTATAALVSGATSLAASASFDQPVYTAAAALSSGATSLAATATFAVDTFTAAAALVGASTSLVASASFTEPTYAGAASLLSGATTLVAAASFDEPVYTAAATLLSGATALAASATFAPPAYTAAAALTSASSTLSSAASFTPSGTSPQPYLYHLFLAG